MKQTAVEWLIEQLNKKAIINGTIDRVVMNYIIEQAKEMEKEQMMQCYEDGYNKVAKLIEDAAKQK